MAFTSEMAAEIIANTMTRAARLAIDLDRLSGRSTTIEVEPEGFIVVVETPRPLAGHLARKFMVARNFEDGVALLSSDRSLVSAVGEAHDKARLAEEEYAERKAKGELTKL